MNLQEVQDRLIADDDGKWDQVIERDEMRMQEGRLRFPRLYRADYPRGLSLTRWAEAQLCQRLNIPTGYYRRCPSHLQDAQVNYWMQREEPARENGNRRREERSERWLLRARHDALRGILSERYARMNNTDVYRSLEPLVKDRYEVQWLAVTDESWHLRLVDPKMAREVTRGDDLYAGLHIANSEVGKRSVTVDALVYRLVCQNGLIRLVKGRSLLHQRHVSLSQPRFEAALTKALREAMVQGVGFMERMFLATRESIPDVEGSLDAIAAQRNWSDGLARQVRDTLAREAPSNQETLYGLVNAVTNVAQTLVPDERYSLETLAGLLLEKGVPKPGTTEVTRSRKRSAVDNSTVADEFALLLTG